MTRQTAIHLRIPARINILGNPSDGVEGDFATISAAIDSYATAVVEPSDQIVLSISNPPGSGIPDQHAQYPCDGLPLPYNGQCDLLKGAINRLYIASEEFRSRLPEQGIRITAQTEVPRQSGLGGSSLFVLLALAGLRAFYDLDPDCHNDYILAELCQRVEEKELGITCGYADRYVPLFGGLAYLDYRGKLHHAPVREEPLVTYERLDACAGRLPLVAVTTGIEHDSGDVHGVMRARYLEEDAAYQSSGGEQPPLLRLMRGAWETAWRGKIALLENDLEAFGKLMTRNHTLVDEMMTLCGFADGAGWANNLFIEAALQNGALGAKLTGAGGGGSVFALVKPGQASRLIEAWQKLADAHNLSSARIFTPNTDPDGLTIG